VLLISPRSAILVASFSLLALVGCKKKEDKDPPPIPVSTAPAPVPVASESAPEPIATAPADPASTAAPTPAPTTPPPSGGPAKRESIDACCAALSAYQKSGRPKNVKERAATAARVCRGASPAVRDGRTSRQAALAQVRASMGGGGPPECQ
jgi:hypothetical protein